MSDSPRREPGKKKHSSKPKSVEGLFDRLKREERERQQALRADKRAEKKTEKQVQEHRLNDDEVRVFIYNKIATCNRTKVAAATGLSPAMISYVVRGLKLPGVETATKIADHLKIQPGDVIDYVVWIRSRKDYARRATKPGGGRKPKRKAAED